MKRSTATSIFECLSSAVRLDIYRLLVRKGLEGEVAGEIAAALKVAASNLSFHLKALTHAKLVSVEQEGRFQRYRANLPLMVELVGYLTEECCAGHPEKCSEGTISATCCDATRPVRRVAKKKGSS